MTNSEKNREPFFQIWGRPNCVWCDRAKDLIDEKGFQYVYTELTTNNLEEFQDYFPGKKTVPQIIVDEFDPQAGWYPRTINGYEGLVEYLK